jgi:putrescine transport system permease protein
VNNRKPFLLFSLLAFGYAFLYIPIISLIVYSFNESRLVTVWGGFSTKWYGELLRNEQILSAAWVSVRVAAMNASLAVLLGTLAALALVRFGRFRGRLLFTTLVSAPLVMPEVILGLASLLLFVAMEQAIGWPAGRGMTTITLAHITFSAAFVTVVVQSRLSQMDTSLEEAAMDLGARPWKVFLLITLPVIAPALVAGWLLAFTLSLDDLIIASFVAGPGSTTLPMVVYSSVRLGVSPQINALATLIVAFVTLCILVAGWLMHRRERQLRPDRPLR